MTEVNPTILLVEDNPSDADLVIRALKRSGLQATIARAHDGVEAVDYLMSAAASGGAAGLPQLVLLDCKLPKLTGVEVLERIRADPRLSHLVVVMLTSSMEGRDVTEAYRAGVNSYVVKPVEFESFFEAVGRVGQYWLGLNQRSPSV